MAPNLNRTRGRFIEQAVDIFDGLDRHGLLRV
jgi:hypothetical protein